MWAAFAASARAVYTALVSSDSAFHSFPTSWGLEGLLPRSLAWSASVERYIIKRFGGRGGLDLDLVRFRVDEFDIGVESECKCGSKQEWEHKLRV